MCVRGVCKGCVRGVSVVCKGCVRDRMCKGGVRGV